MRERTPMPASLLERLPRLKLIAPTGLGNASIDLAAAAAGANYVIATEEEDLLKEIDKITRGQAARVVFDPVGGPRLSKIIKVMSFQGLLYLHGALSDQVTTVPVLYLIGKIITIKGHNIWLPSGNPARQKTAADFVINGLEKGTLKPGRVRWIES
jgi:NADPH:quinone reductase-like Zn-dependent oxidoreductase